MSRPIKFRLWKKSIKKYIDLTAFTMTNDGEITAVVDSSILEPALDKDNYILEQYTGLKDKNDKEIYEGDIVEYRALRLLETSPTIDVIFDPARAVVEFEDGCFIPFNYNEDIVKLDTIEVIGNIHENPELLGGEE